MTKEQKQQIFLGVCMAAVVIVLLYQFVFAGGSSAPPPAAKSNAAAPASGAAGATPAPAPAAAAAAADAGGPTRLAEVNIKIDELIAGVEDVTFDYRIMRIDRDPLAALVGGPLKLDLPIEGGTVPTGSLSAVTQKKITGIVYDEYSPMAVVDDEVVGIGHVYPNGIRVHSIDRDKVTFQLGDSLIPVEMKEQ